MAGDPHRLERFRHAQDQDETYERALSELRGGRKLSHWMWFVFPQLDGLGRSPTARHYAIASLDEARAYLADPTLGPRILEAARTLVEQPVADADAVLGSVDAIKLRSSMTLFARADPDQPLFTTVLGRFFDGQPDPLTERLLRG